MSVEAKKLRFYVVIPAHNEQDFIGKTLQSLVDQKFRPEKVVVVNDHSSDNTAQIVSKFAQEHDFVSLLNITSSDEHIPFGKEVTAFYKGFDTLDDNYDIICKYDADLIFPAEYFSVLNEVFSSDEQIGMAGGFCYIEKEGEWILESLTGKDHIRGALKAYRKKCFEDIGGLRTAMGWDTVDELLARYHGWKIQTIPELKVKHLKPTGDHYSPGSEYRQGEGLYRLNYGWTIAFIASAKMAWVHKDLKVMYYNLKGFYLAKKQKLPYLVTPEEGKWIRNYRWKKIREKLLGGK